MFKTPAYVLRVMPDRLPEKEISKDIFLKLWDNPKLLDGMDEQFILSLSEIINNKLGIFPFKTRNAGYLGD